MPTKADDPNFKGLRQKIGNEEGENKYFHRMLNMADDDLDPYEYRLLGHYIRVGTCWEGTRKTAENTKMSIGMVSKVRDKLAANGWIRVEYRDNNESCLITVVDRMAENVARYSGRSYSEHSVHEVNTPVHTVNTSVHEVNERRTIEEEPKKKPARSRKSSEPSPESLKVRAVNDLILAYADVNKVAGNPYNKTGYRSSAEGLHDKGVTSDELRAFLAEQKATWAKNRHVSWTNIENNILTWKENHKPRPAVPVAMPLPASFDAMPAPVVIPAYGKEQPHD